MKLDYTHCLLMLFLSTPFIPFLFHPSFPSALALVKCIEPPIFSSKKELLILKILLAQSEN
jgi:hypothetical protein